jgi:hypothetical protein
MLGGVDIVILSLASFLGNVGVALTGFGMAIIFLFAWQIAVLAGYDSTFKYVVFIQALALFSAQVSLWRTNNLFMAGWTHRARLLHWVVLCASLVVTVFLLHSP